MHVTFRPEGGVGAELAFKFTISAAVWLAAGTAETADAASTKAAAAIFLFIMSFSPWKKEPYFYVNLHAKHQSLFNPRITSSPRSRIFLRSVLRLRPSRCAARIWLPRVAPRQMESSGRSTSASTRS